MTSNTEQFCGFIAIVGRPNVGKSTLVNALVGEKISIVSRRAQTTRHRIHGVLTEGAHQLVFVDTPGFQTRYGGSMNHKMNRAVREALADVDIIAHVVEADKWTEEDVQVQKLLPTTKPVLLVINKVDVLKDKSQLLPYIEARMGAYQYDAVVPISASRKTQLGPLQQELMDRLPAGQFLFDEETLTDRPLRFLVAEIIREKIFRLVGDELPYQCGVVIEAWEETDTLVTIDACVYVERENHRPILLGTGGQHMKRIASEARQDILRLLDKRVALSVYIKVRRGWRDDASILRDLGHD